MSSDEQMRVRSEVLIEACAESRELQVGRRVVGRYSTFLFRNDRWKLDTYDINIAPYH